MNEVARVLDLLVADAPIERKSWADVRARVRTGRPRRVAVAAAAAATLALAGTAVAFDVVDRVREQERALNTATAPDLPDLVGRFVEITSTDEWALTAWRTTGDVVCVSFVVVPGKSPLMCGLPVRGAKPAHDTGGTGPPTHAVAGDLSSGGLIGMDGKAIGKSAVFGVAAAGVASVRVELADGRLIDTAIYDAPPELGADVRFFIVRLHLPPTRLGGSPPVAAFRAYDVDGRLIERYPL